MHGYSYGGTSDDLEDFTSPVNARDSHERAKCMSGDCTEDRKGDAKEAVIGHLTDSMMESTRRSRVLESQVPLRKGPIGDMLRNQDETTHNYNLDEFDCSNFQRDLQEFSDSFKSFYSQVREIEAETGCYFDDLFMVETERAVDYTKAWIETFQSHERP
ncbi:MAG: hypothetical protein Q9190_007020, partial [Brigantiaea leucoxantha]